MITMKQFMSILKKKMSEHVKSLMVGDRCIRMHIDGSCAVHYFLLDNCPWYVHTSAKPPFNICPNLSVFIIRPNGSMLNVHAKRCW